jgi:hypothetical protein
VSEFNMRYWRKQKDAVLQTTNKSRKEHWGPKSGKFPEPEDEILEYVRGLRNNSVGVSHEMFHFKACEIATRQGNSPSQFKVSRRWMFHFMKRKGLSLRRRASPSQRMPKYFDDKIIVFHKFVIRLRKNNSYLLSQIHNTHQTPLYFNIPTNTTLKGKGKKSVIICTSGCEKQHCTVMLTITVNGRKLPLYVIFKRKTMQKPSYQMVFMCMYKTRVGWMVCHWVHTF